MGWRGQWIGLLPQSGRARRSRAAAAGQPAAENSDLAFGPQLSPHAVLPTSSSRAVPAYARVRGSPYQGAARAALSEGSP